MLLNTLPCQCTRVGIFLVVQKQRYHTLLFHEKREHQEHLAGVGALHLFEHLQKSLIWVATGHLKDEEKC